MNRLNLSAFRFLFSCASLTCLLCSSIAQGADSYKLGDVATQEVITPVAFTVINPEATEALQEKEALKVPVVIRFRAQTADEAEAALRAAFKSAHSNFTDTLYRTMKGRAVSVRSIDTPLFKRAVESTRKQTKGFPLLDELAPLWARDESGADKENELAAKLRAILSQPIIARRLAEGINTGNSFRIITVLDWNHFPTMDEATNSGRVVKGNQVRTLPTVRNQLLTNSVTEAQQASAKFISRFLTTNSAPDMELTRLLRARQVEGLAATDSYEAAQVIVRAGQVIDRKTLAALTMLREKTAIGRLQNKLSTQEEIARQQAAEIQKVTDSQQVAALQQETAATQNKRLLLWIAIGFGVVVGMLILILRRIRSHKTTSLLPALTNPGDSDSNWRERAITAEATAEQARHAMKGGFLYWMGQRLIKGLTHQRAELLSSQQLAEAEMHGLEKRLEQLHTPLQERISAYEKRIGELEKDLAVKGEENRELIRAKIVLAKQQLTLERERGRGGFGTN